MNLMCVCRRGCGAAAGLAAAPGGAVVCAGRACGCCGCCCAPARGTPRTTPGTTPGGSLRMNLMCVFRRGCVGPAAACRCLGGSSKRSTNSLMQVGQLKVSSASVGGRSKSARFRCLQAWHQRSIAKRSRAGWGTAASKLLTLSPALMTPLPQTLAAASNRSPKKRTWARRATPHTRRRSFLRASRISPRLRAQQGGPEGTGVCSSRFGRPLARLQPPPALQTIDPDPSPLCQL